MYEIECDECGAGDVISVPNVFGLYRCLACGTYIDEAPNWEPIRCRRTEDMEDTWI